MKFAVIASLLFSILATILFFGQKLGISMLIFVLPFLVFTIYLLEKYKKVKNRRGYSLGIAIILLSVTYAIYQNTFFKVLNILVMLILYGIMLLDVMQAKYQLEFVIRRICVLFTKPFIYFSKALCAIRRIFPVKQNVNKLESKNKKMIEQIIIGIVASVPLLIIVTMLLASADADFADGIGSIFWGLIEKIIQILDKKVWLEICMKVGIIIVLTIYLISIIINLLRKNPWSNREEKAIQIRIETIILNTIVTVLNFIYIAFCIIQVKSLLQVENGTFSYAHYAREGFFQLMAVSIINFMIMVVTTKNTIQSTKYQIYYRKFMNLVLAIATIIILISAFLRMNLYGEAYGYTFLRILVYFALITEGILMIPTIIYILKDNFMPWKSYLIIVTVMYLVMNFSNISQIIAKQNINRYLNDIDNVSLDVVYLMQTKEDGLEEVIKLYEKTDDLKLKYQLELYFKGLKEKLSEEDSFTQWNYSRWNARKLLEDMELENNSYNPNFTRQY